MTASVQNEVETVYNPSSLLNIFTSSLNNETTRKVIKVKGIYIAGKGTSYNGLFYDTLKDEATDASMTLVIAGLVRTQLSSNEVIECSAYLTKKVQLNGGRIDLQLNVVDVISKASPTYTETQLKGFEILRKKAELGHKDVDSFIKSKIINGKPIIVTIIIGKSAIIDEDIKHQLKEAIGLYKFYFIKINLASTKEIIESLNYYQRKCDILTVARGGGENLDIFENPDIANASLSLSSYFITALGHKENVPLLQKVADKAFITPTAARQYFNEIYNNTIAELQNSKAKLVRDITTQLDAHYQKQIENLNNNLLNIEKNREREIGVLNQQLQGAKEEKAANDSQVKDLQQQLEKAKRLDISTILLIVAALIIGVLIGKLFM